MFPNIYNIITNIRHFQGSRNVDISTTTPKHIYGGGSLNKIMLNPNNIRCKTFHSYAIIRLIYKILIQAKYRII